MSRSAALADRMGQLTGLPVRDARVVGAQHGYQHLMLTLSGGRRAFAKAVPPPAPHPNPAQSSASPVQPSASPVQPSASPAQPSASPAQPSEPLQSENP